MPEQRSLRSPFVRSVADTSPDVGSVVSSLASSPASIGGVAPRSIRRSVLFSAALLLAVAGWLTAPAAHAQAGTSYGLFGSPRCADWAGMSPESRSNWTRAFISALSKGYEEIRRAGKQKFSNSEGVDQVVDAIDRHCASSPQAQAADAIAPFLN